LWWKDGDPRHNHLPCSECTITLDDVTLQLGLPTNVVVVMGLMGIEIGAQFNNDVSHVGIPDELEDIRLLLDQRSEDKHRYGFIPMHEPILPPDLTTSSAYMTWFKLYGKPYLLSEEERSRQRGCRRPRRPHMNLRLEYMSRVIISSNPT
ncbi:hypothetical protein Golob_011580, partial [Gossypium lobatum]|nr:hypothetical protein [Gossypium lobatum]